MVEFIQKFWLESLLTLILSGLLAAVRWLANKIKKEHIEQEQIKAGVLALLHHKNYFECERLIDQGQASIRELKNLEYLYEAYHKLGGNGTGTELYERVLKLPTKQ